MGKASKKKKIKKTTEPKSSTSEKACSKSNLFSRTFIHLILIVIVGFLSYSNTFRVPFQFDEVFFISENPIVKDISYFLEPSKVANLGKQYFHFKNRYIGYLTFALNYKIHGLDVIGYHIVNFFIHIINALLVYLLVITTLKTPFFVTSTAKKYSKHIAFLSSLLFVSHPVQTEAVTYIYQRLASLAALFYLLSLVMYIKWRLINQNSEHRTQSTEGKTNKIFNLKSVFWHLGSVTSAILAMKTKENAFTLPIVITLFEFFFFTGRVKVRILRLTPFIMTLFIIPLTLLGTDKPTGKIIDDIGVATKRFSGISRFDYLLTQFRVIVTYIRILFFPANQNLDYSYPKFNSFIDLQVFLSFIFLSFILAFALYLFYRSRFTTPDLRIISFGIFWFFITLSVESSVLPISIVINEYRVYLPSAGFFVAIMSGIFLLFEDIKCRKIRTIALLSLLVVISVLSYTTYTRNAIWESKISLWEDVIKKAPRNIRAHNNLGNAYLAKGFIDKAIEHYLVALNLKPDYVEAHNNLGTAYSSKGFTDKAIEHYLVALNLKPDYAEAHINLGLIYIERKRIDKARKEFQMALQTNPDMDKARQYLELINKTLH